MSRRVTKKPPVQRLRSAELKKLSADKLREKFGPRTYLGKFDIAPDEKAKCGDPDEYPLWQVLTFHSVGRYEVQGKGPNARSALSDAGLGGWVEDLERGRA